MEPRKGAGLCACLDERVVCAGGRGGSMEPREGAGLRACLDHMLSAPGVGGAMEPRKPAGLRACLDERVVCVWGAGDGTKEGLPAGHVYLIEGDPGSSRGILPPLSSLSSSVKSRS